MSSGAKETPYDKTPNLLGVFEYGEDVINIMAVQNN